MLQHYPEDRIPIEEIKKHPWYLMEVPSYEEIVKDLTQRMQEFNERKQKEIE